MPKLFLNYLYEMLRPKRKKSLLPTQCCKRIGRVRRKSFYFAKRFYMAIPDFFTTFGHGTAFLPLVTEVGRKQLFRP